MSPSTARRAASDRRGCHIHTQDSFVRICQQARPAPFDSRHQPQKTASKKCFPAITTIYPAFGLSAHFFRMNQILAITFASHCISTEVVLKVQM
jgi:hypothetical protein